MGMGLGNTGHYLYDPAKIGTNPMPIQSGPGPPALSLFATQCILHMYASETPHPYPPSPKSPREVGGEPLKAPLAKKKVESDD